MQSLQPPPSAGTTLSGEEGMLLQYAYSEKSIPTSHDATMNSFVRQLSLVHGVTLNFPALRHAVLSWAARQLPPEQYELQFLEHQNLALQYLRANLHSEDCWEDALFTSTILAWNSYSSFNEQTSVRSHWLGAGEILMALQRSPSKRSGMLTAFAPFVLDCISAWSVRYGGVPSRWTSFSQRVIYFEQLFRVATSHSSQTGTADAVNATLGNVLEMSLTCLSAVVEEATGRPPLLDEMSLIGAIHHIRDELCDMDLQHALVAIQVPSGNGETIHEQLTSRLIHRHKCILLIDSILKERTRLLPSLCSSTAVSAVARGLISSLRWGVRQNLTNDYYRTTWHGYSHLLLGGLPLRGEDQERRALDVFLC